MRGKAKKVLPQEPPCADLACTNQSIRAIRPAKSKSMNPKNRSVNERLVSRGNLVLRNYQVTGGFISVWIFKAVTSLDFGYATLSLMPCRRGGPWKPALKTQTYSRRDMNISSTSIGPLDPFIMRTHLRRHPQTCGGVDLRWRLRSSGKEQR